MKRITYFLSGALAALLISSATVSAFASSGLITLNVQPAQVMVNGEVFQPKDAQGRDALVFTYNSTTYAPVRALAEAYGLTVGYDAARKHGHRQSVLPRAANQQWQFSRSVDGHGKAGHPIR